MPTPTTVVLFGATGDLAQRKLLPGLLHLFETGLIPEIQVVATSLDDYDQDSFVEFARAAVTEFGGDRDLKAWDSFAPRLHWAPGEGGPEALRKAVAVAEADAGSEESRRLHYLSVPPKAALEVVHMLDEAGLVERSRIIMEKPFGVDLESARTLNAELHQVFDEQQIFRIDHFLGKEAAQNILAFRFANGLFEPIWHRNHIDHVQIDVPESLGLAQRANFYEATGAYRDMVVTHLFQVMAFTAMEPPTALEPFAISEEKNKVFRSMTTIEPHDVVRGQYVGYRDIEGVAPTRRPRRSSRSSASSTTGAGPVCPSTCAPARSWPKGPGSSRSRSRSRRGRCSRPARASATTAPTTSRSTSPTGPRCRSPSTASAPARA
jgi:glucose-6-phosphate 1-dehydrogenase